MLHPAHATVLMLLAAVAACAQDDGRTRVDARMEEVFDWKNPLALTLDGIEQHWAREGFSGSPVYSEPTEGTNPRRLKIGRRPYTNIEVDLSAAEGRLTVADGWLHFRDDRPSLIEMQFEEEPDAVRAILDELWSESEARAATFRLNPTTSATFTTWHLGSATAVLTEAAGSFTSLRIAPAAEAAALAFLQASNGFLLATDLGFLTQGADTWGITPDALDQRFANPMQEDPLHFAWLDTDRTRARFTRKPFGNVLVGLHLFDGQVQLEEATLEFEEGRLARASLSVYNRGDAGSLTVPEFQQRIQTCGRLLGEHLGVAPRKRPADRNSAVRTVSWQWTTPHSIALMDHNDISKTGSVGASDQPEFLRIKLASTEHRDWNLGITQVGQRQTTVSRDHLKRQVVHAENGDVWIPNVPMVDQGQKGYCVVASCQRLFEYYHIPCDQHQLAQLVGTTAAGGTTAAALEEGLDRIDAGFKTRFKVHIGPRMDRRDRQRLDVSRFAKMVQDAVDDGVPLLWTLQLGRAPEEPPLPASGQQGGGHLRMIIGYNPKQKRILFTDSWGAGHERKYMDLEWAFRVTDGLYTMTPRSY